MESGNALEYSANLDHMQRDKKYRNDCFRVISANVCALLNSKGGELRVSFDDENVTAVVVEGFVRSAEQHLQQFVSICSYKKNVKISMPAKKQLVFAVLMSSSLCTIDYHLCIPTYTKVERIPAIEHPEQIKDILRPNRKPEIIFSEEEEFVYNEPVSFTESDSVQFKCLKDDKSKCVTIADRVTNKTNKFCEYISAFANHNGGRLYYGIENNGIVRGEKLSTKEIKVIKTKVTKAISKMIWFKEKIRKGEHWTMEFKPVKREKNGEAIASLFVLMISVHPLPGGVFTEIPESYYIGLDGKVGRMPFDVWSSRFFYEIRPVNVPSSLGRTTWSNTHLQEAFCRIIHMLVDLQNQASYSKFWKFAKLAKTRYGGSNLELLVKAEESVVAYKVGQIKKAKMINNQLRASLSMPGTNFENITLLQFREIYVTSAIARASGDYEESYRSAQTGQQLAVIILASVLTAWFYNHVAILEKFLSQHRQAKERARMEESSLNYYIKALQHAQISSVEQKYTDMIADLEGRIHVFRAITSLGNFATGTSLQDLTQSRIKAAETDLQCYQSLINEGFHPTKYRKNYYLLALCDLHLAQWYQQLKERQPQQMQLQSCQKEQQQDHSHNQFRKYQQEPQVQNVSGSYQMPEILKEAHNLALKARKISSMYRFEELTIHANNRLRQITEMMVKFNFVSTFKVATHCKKKAH